MNRRDLLRGAAACSVVAAVPGLALPTAPETYRLLVGGVPLGEALSAEFGFGPIFKGAISLYGGIIIRHVEYVEALPDGARVLIRDIPMSEVYADGR